jgi:heat shock protein HslJ
MSLSLPLTLINVRAFFHKEFVGPKFDKLLRLAALAFAIVQGCATAPEPAQPVLPPPPEFVFEPLPDGEWELVTASFAETGQFPGARRATLTIKDGRISAFSGCNTASGAVQRHNGLLEVPEFAVTRRGCPGPLGWFEARYFGLLKERPSYLVEGDTLTLVADNERARFRRPTAAAKGTQ